MTLYFPVQSRQCNFLMSCATITVMYFRLHFGGPAHIVPAVTVGTLRKKEFIMSLDRFRIFVPVAKSPTFTHAAAELHL